MEYSHHSSEASSPPQEPRVHGKGWALVFLIVGLYYSLSGIAILLFPRNEAQLRAWWLAVLLGLALCGVSCLFFRRRRRELDAHERWAADFAAWQQKQADLAQAAHELEMERLEKQLEIEKAELARIKAKAAAEFGLAQGAEAEIAVSGTSRRQNAIKSLGFENDEYRYTKRQIQVAGLEDEEIERLHFPDLAAALVPDPGNPHDANAIKVLLSGVFIGYIPAESAVRVKQLMDHGKISHVSARIVGGPYMVYDSVEDEFYKKDLLYGVRLHLQIKA